LSNKVNFFHIAFVANNHSSRGVKPAEHIDNELVSKTSFAFVEEMVERLFKLLEHSRILNQLCLHLRCDLLVERKLLNDQVKVILECLLNVLSNIVVKCWLDVERFV